MNEGSPSTDFIEKAVSVATGIACSFVSVTDSVQELERCHLSGPTAARVLGEAVAGTALLSGVLSRPDERLTVQIGCDGPVRGVMVEVNGEGCLRGFTYIKVLNAFDDNPHVDLAAVMGAHGQMQVIHSSATQVLASGQINATPPNVRQNLTRYLVESVQTPAALSLFTHIEEGHLVSARGFLCERMPDSRPDEFVPILERFNSGEMDKALEAATCLEDMRAVVGLADLAIRERKPLRFACHCSYEKTLAMLAVLPNEDLEEMIASEDIQEVTCHFCGQGYRVPAQEIRTILTLKNSTST